MAKQDVIELGGTVLDILLNAIFKVELENGHETLAHVGDKIRTNYIRILSDNKVTAEMSPYNLSRDRTTYRYK